jgi:SsrA-binding protein
MTVFDEIRNKKANYNYFIEETFEAGLVLQGWEFKSILKKKANLDNAYVVVKNGELFLLNALITPMETVSTHIAPESTRSRKLLMHRKEIHKLIGQVEQKGYTLMPLKIIRNNRGKLKLIFGLAKGKKNYDKRETEKEKDWKREQEQMFKRNKT